MLKPIRPGEDIVAARQKTVLMIEKPRGLAADSTSLARASMKDRTHRARRRLRALCAGRCNNVSTILQALADARSWHQKLLSIRRAIALNSRSACWKLADVKPSVLSSLMECFATVT